MARSDGYGYGYGYGGGNLGITNPFATNIPNLGDIDKTISEIEHNRLLGEDLRSQIAERAANVAWQQQQDDFGGDPRKPVAAPAATGGGTSGGAATLAPYVPRNLPPGITPEEDLRVRTAWGEARGEGAVGQQAVDAVIANRVAQSGRPLSDVLFAPKQFTPWNDPATRAKLEALDPTSPEYQTILTNLRARKDDPTGGATHFYSPRAQAAAGDAPPTWGNAEPSAVIGGHNFYRIGYAPGGGAPGAFPGTATAAAPPAAPPPPARTGPGVAGRYPGAYDTTGAAVAPPSGAPGGVQGQAGGGPQFTSPAEAVALGSAGRALLQMPEADAAAAYPGMIKELQAQGFALKAPPTYPGHAGIQHLAEVGQTAQSGPDAPYAVAGETVPPPTPPEPTNDRGLTASDIRELQEFKHSKGATRATVAQAEMTLRQRNQAAQEAYRTNMEQAQTRTENLTQRNRENVRQDAADARARHTQDLADQQAVIPALTEIAPKILDGTATPAERLRYSGLMTMHFTKPTTSWLPDPDDPSKVKPVTVPGDLPPGFPAPDYKPGDPVGPQPKPSKPAAMSPTQGKVAVYADRMIGADPIINQFDQDALSWAEQAKAQAGDFIGYNINSPNYQQYRQAQENWLTAYLRDQSGAQINTDEYKRDRMIFFPMPGESPELVKQKREARGAVMRGMQREAGSAYAPQATPGGGGGAGPQPPVIKSDDDYNALPSGATFYDPKGQLRTKP